MLALKDLVEHAYREDIPTHDITCTLTVTDDTPATATIIAKSDGVFFGTDVVTACLSHKGPNIQFTQRVHDGDRITPQQTLIELTGPLHQLLQVERVLLNFLQRLCGIATMTSQFIKKLDNPHIQILETRKTTPLLRSLEKQAVVAGGGQNHRMNLSDMVLIKENHLAALENTGQLHTLRNRLLQFKAQNPTIKIEIEIETLDQIETLPLDLADIVMFDNFALDMITVGAKALRDRGSTALIEISGNVTLHTIDSYRELPIDRISVGALTHSVPAMDLSMRIHVNPLYSPPKL